MNKHPDQPPPYGFQEPPPSFPQQQPIHVEVQQMPPAPQVIIIGGSNSVGPTPQLMTCPSCHHQISTRTETEAVTKTHLMALLLCLFCCWPCACIPYCTDSCQNINHYCPHCKSFLGTYNA